ncbi:protein ABHD15 [Periophthalmus magnuspinnatus]|uniref:protein ABHD15 n=1 Tax=Periophthalmus magnuspinnatus TaxID=409849 RepID=UPI00145B13F8|nr:protein ABHD15 [Periophthalmus magnuspinnatus]
MLECLVVVLIVILVVFIWPGSAYFYTEGQTDALLEGLSHTEDRNSDAKNHSFTHDKHDVTTDSVAFICKPSALANYLLKHCRSFSDYSPCVGWPWRASAVLQSAYEACWPYYSAVQFVRDNLQLSDEGLVALDWAVPSHQRRRRTSSHSSSPVLLIVPNSFGRITRNVQKLCETALFHGYLPVVFNRRGHNGTPLTSVKLQQFGDPSDLREAVRYIRYRQPAGRLYAVSESTGAGLLLSYLGECGSSSYVTAAVCLSPVFRCQNWFDKGLWWPLQWGITLYQKFSLCRYRSALGQIIQTEHLFSKSTLRGIEEALFCHNSTIAPPTGSSLSWDAYWEHNEPLRDVDEVAIPVLSICAKDDPIRGDTKSTIPLELFETNPHFFLLLTDRGGHCAFSTISPTTCRDVTPNNCGADKQEINWSHKTMLEFFRASTDFFAVEERSKQLAARRRGLGGVGRGRAFRNRSISTCKRVPACSHNIHAIYNWQRSYTR